MSTIGFLDDVSINEVKGWAFHPVSEKPVIAKLFLNNKLIQQKICNELRQDLVKNGIHSTGQCGFSFKMLPGTANEYDEIRVYAGDELIELNNSPWKLLIRDIVERKKIRKGKKSKQFNKDFLIEPRPLICTNKQLGLLWSAKSGCTFALKWFLFQLDLLNAALYYHSWVHRFREDVFYESMPYRHFFKNVSQKPILWIKVVRSPFTRAVSSYIHAIRFGYENDRISKYLGRILDSNKGFSFREFVFYLNDLDISSCNIHHRLQIHPVEEKGLARNFEIVKLEESMELFQKIENKYGLPKAPLKSFRRSKHHSIRIDNKIFSGDTIFSKEDKNFPTFSTFYDKETIDLVLKLYKKDFDRYGYSLDIEQNF